MSYHDECQKLNKADQIVTMLQVIERDGKETNLLLVVVMYWW